MIIKNNPYLWVGVNRDQGEVIQYVAIEKGFSWSNGRKLHKPYLPKYGLAFDFEELTMYFYDLESAKSTWPDGERSRVEMVKILKKLSNEIT